MNIESEARFSLIAERLSDLGQWERLFEHCAKRLRITPDDPLTHYYAGLAAGHCRPIATMGAHVRSLLSVDAESTLAHDLAFRYWCKLGRYDYCLYHAGEMQRLDPESARGMTFAGSAYFFLGQFSLARKMFREARKLDPLDPDLARLYLRCEYTLTKSPPDLARLDSECLTLLQLDPSIGDSHLAVADFFLFAVGDMQRAIRHYQNALSIDPTLMNGVTNWIFANRQQNWITRTFFWHRTAWNYRDPARKQNAPESLLSVLVSLFVELAILAFRGISVCIMYVPSVLMEIFWQPSNLRAEFLQRRISWDPVQSGWPAWLRTSMLCLAIAGYWALAWWLLARSIGGIWIPIVVLGNGVAAAISFRRWKNRHAEKRDQWLVLGLVVGGSVGLAWHFGIQSGAATVCLVIACWALYSLGQSAIERQQRSNQNATEVGMGQRVQPPLP